MNSCFFPMFVLGEKIKSYISKLRKNKAVNPYIFLIITSLCVVFTLTINFTWSAEDVSQSVFKSTIVLFAYIATYYFIAATILKLLALIPKIRKHRLLVLVCTVLCFLIIRFIAIHFQIPHLLFSTVFFLPCCATVDLYSQNLGILFIDSTLLMFIATIGLKYFTFLRCHPKLVRNCFFTGVALFVYFTALLLLLFAVVYIMGTIVKDNNFMINPDKMLFFDVYSILITFMFFIFLYSFALLVHKVMRVTYFFFNKKPRRIAFFILALLGVVSIIVFTFFPNILGFPAWIVLAFLVVYLFAILLTILYNKNNFQFISVIANIIVFSVFTSIILSFFIENKEAQDRQNFITSIIAHKPEITKGDTISKELLNDNYNNVYSSNNPTTCSWISKSDKYINRSYINRYSKLTTQYSFAYFVNNQLIDQYGQYDYKLNAKDYTNRKKNESPNLDYVIVRDYRHYIYPLNDKEVIIISQKEEVGFEVISFFSYFFISFTLFYVFIFFMSKSFIRMKRQTLSLYNRLLWTTLSVLLLISFVACTLSLHYYVKRTENERREQVMVKMGAIQLRFMKEYGTFEHFRNDSSHYEEVRNYVDKLSNTFFVNVNLYDTTGALLFCSQTDVPGVQGKLAPEILLHFKQDYSYYFEEKYDDSRSIYSIYKTLTDKNGNFIGVYNVNDVKNRYAHDLYMSSFISKYLKLYALIIFLSIFASWLIYYFVSKPMGYIGDALSSKERRNKPIHLNWSDNEEIGQLIREHNRMVEELRKNAELLAKSERETAWREMALEIAHEIKNPLTPMKLKMQMLERAWQENREDFDNRIKNVSNLILSQIDILTEVADTFSEFSDTQQSTNTVENLKDLLIEQQNKYPNTIDTTYIFYFDKNKDYCATVDKKLFDLMFYYLIKNAYHNRKEDGKLQVGISLTEDLDEHYWLLNFSTDDCGLDDVDISSVFSIKFSAGNCGHSLCLPIVKNIVVGFHGEISFSTEKGKGTEFFIRIPKL